VTAGFGVDALEGTADSGDLSEDMTDLFVALGEAAADHGKGVVFLFDEVQFLEMAEFEALIAALHRTVQRQLPITFVGAGLPQLPRLAGEAKSYAERLFHFPSIGELTAQEAASALTEPAKSKGWCSTTMPSARSPPTPRGIRISCKSTGRLGRRRPVAHRVG
jgi:hypothetical protein